jgi:hypothetical protein
MRSDRAEFLRVMREEFPNEPEGLVRTIATALMRRATRSQKYAELLCSVDMGEKGQARVEKQDEKNDDAIERLAAQLGMKCRIGGDPRGFVVSVFLPSGRSNSWGGKEHGWGVPSDGYTAAQLERMMG